MSGWDDDEARRHTGPLGPRVYTSRLLGRDPTLVLHGGGNTSVKLRQVDLVGDEEDVLFVKGSGADLATIDESGFAPVRLARLLRLAELEELSDRDMARELRAATLDPAAPAPSVEAILHALLPYPYVDHTHADAVLTLTNNARADELVAEVYGDSVVVVPYVMPGFELARACAVQFPKEATDRTVGMLLLNHGMFTFGADARESYERMVHLVGLAATFVGSLGHRRRPSRPRPPASPAETAELRLRVSRAAGKPMVMTSCCEADTMAFVEREDVQAVSSRGPATPDHVIRTKAVPMVGRDVDAYVEAYEQYFDRHGGPHLRRLDPAPRVVLDPALGMCCIGESATDARIAADIYRHTMQIVEAAEALGGYRTLAPADVFAVEYWDLEQAKLARRPAPLPLTGQVALVTGAAGGIGRACADALLANGAAVVGVDRDPAVAEDGGDAWRGVVADLTAPDAWATAIGAAAAAFGGLDVLVLNAGVFPPGRSIAELPAETWQAVMAVNLDANLGLLQAAHSLLKRSPVGGRVVVVGSKNVPAPGPGAAAYSVSKAALTQLARVAAMEWAGDGITVNVVHPNAVFDTGVWTDETLRERAASYGMTVEEYRTNNLLGVEVTSADVAALCVAMCGPAFAKTTGAQVPVDGGNDRVL